MTDEQLKKMWKDAGTGHIRFNKSALPGELNAAMQQMDKAIVRRNSWELWTAVFVMLIFSFIAWKIPPVLSKIGALLFIPCALMIITVLRRTRKKNAEDIALPVKDFLLQYKQYLESERALLRRIVLWYVAPILLCAGLIAVGMHKYLPFASMLVLSVGVTFLNRYAAEKQFTPLIQKIDREIDTLVAEEDQ